MKMYTDYDQSVKLAEILPADTADMYWLIKNEKPVKAYLDIEDIKSDDKCSYCPCWSLPTLFNMLPDIGYEAGCSWEICRLINVNKNALKDQYYVTGHDMWDHEIIGPYYDEPIDACANMIIELHKNNYIQS